MRIVLLLTFLLTLLPTLHARDPYHVIPDYGYDGEPTISGGDGWTFGDYWVVGGVALMVAAVVALPRIFDGKNLAYPAMCRDRSLTDFRSLQPPRMIVSPGRRWGLLNSPRRFLFPTFNNIEQHRIIYKFPTRKV